MTQEQINDFEKRLRKVEDFILSQLNTLLELSQSLKTRIEVLEEDDKEFKAYIHQTCTLKDKEIEASRKSAIDISCNHADNNHKQTWGVVAFIATSLISAIVYFNHEDTQRSLDIQKHETQIANISSTLDKIDDKMDKIYAHIQHEEKK